MAYSEEAQSALIDAKMILDCVLYDDDYHNTLQQYGTSRESVKKVWDILENIIYEDQIDYNLETGEKNAFDTTDADQTWTALHKSYELVNGIDDPWLWTEREADLNEFCDDMRAMLEIDE